MFRDSHAKKCMDMLTDVNEAQAVRDYQFMTEVSQQPFDYFIASSERYLDKQVIQHVIESKKTPEVSFRNFVNMQNPTYENMEQNATATGPWSGVDNPEALGGTRNASSRAVIRRNL